MQWGAIADKAKKCCKNLSRCRNSEFENGFDREDVLSSAQRVGANLTQSAVGSN
jgi:hypothetical protein